MQDNLALCGGQAAKPPQAELPKQGRRRRQTQGF